MEGTDEYDFNRTELIGKIIEILNGVENIRILEHFYLFIRKAVTIWR